MGKIKKGILGGFSGKVGTVVGANWKTISYMRSLPQKVRNPRTLAQQKQRGKFALVVALLKPIIPFLRVGWKLYAHKQSAYNAASSYTLANAVTGTFPNYQIDFDKLLVSRGNLTPANTPQLDAVQNQITMRWTDNSNVGTAKPTDKALAVVLNTTSGEAIFIESGSTRASGQQKIALPENWAGNKVYCYLGFVSDDGREVANSYCYGEHTVQSA
jgi:hypothetical protein